MPTEYDTHTTPIPQLHCCDTIGYDLNITAVLRDSNLDKQVSDQLCAGTKTTLHQYCSFSNASLYRYNGATNIVAPQLWYDHVRENTL
jgi:hypothetical protein